MDLMKRHGAKVKAVVNPVDADGYPSMPEDQQEAARDVFREVAGMAEAHLATAKALCAGQVPRGMEAFEGEILSSGPMPSVAKLAFLPAVRARLYLNDLRRLGYSHSHPSLWPMQREEDTLLRFQLRLLGARLGVVSAF